MEETGRKAFELLQKRAKMDKLAGKRSPGGWCCNLPRVVEPRRDREWEGGGGGGTSGTDSEGGMRKGLIGDEIES